MEIDHMPFCCTSAVIGMFGEHGEESVVTAKEVARLIDANTSTRRDRSGEVIFPGKRFILATSINPKTIRLLQDFGFHVIDNYSGEQGEVFVLSFHVGK